MLGHFTEFLSTPIAMGLAWLAGGILFGSIAVLLWRLNLSLTLSSLKKRQEELALQVSLIERERHYLERMRCELQSSSTE